jgi:hypothetical protein
VDRAVVGHARLEDLAYATEDQLALLGIFFANGITPLYDYMFSVGSFS